MVGGEEVGSCCGGELGRVKGEVSEGGQKCSSGEVGRARGDERVREGELGDSCLRRGVSSLSVREERSRSYPPSAPLKSSKSKTMQCAISTSFNPLQRFMIPGSRCVIFFL
jgi:hypothetical protein